MPVQVAWIPLGRRDLDLGDALQVVFVIETISQHVAKIAQSTLERVGGRLLLGLLKCGRLALAIFNMSVANVFVERTVPDRDANDRTQAECNLAVLRVLVDKVNLRILNGTRPAIEAEDFVGEVDDFFSREVVNLATTRTRPRGDVFGAQLLVEPVLKRRNLLC